LLFQHNLWGNNLLGYLMVLPNWVITNLLGHMWLIIKELITNNLVCFAPGKQGGGYEKWYPI